MFDIHRFEIVKKVKRFKAPPKLLLVDATSTSSVSVSQLVECNPEVGSTYLRIGRVFVLCPPAVRAAYRRQGWVPCPKGSSSLCLRCPS